MIKDKDSSNVPERSKKADNIAANHFCLHIDSPLLLHSFNFHPVAMKMIL